MLNTGFVFVVIINIYILAKKLVCSSNFKIIFYEKVISIKNHKK